MAAVTDGELAHDSALTEPTAAWARERGFKIGLPNRLVITKVRDAAATLEVLKAAFAPRYLRQEVEPFLSRLPLRLELTWPDTALLLDALRTSDLDSAPPFGVAARSGTAFDYEVNPS